MKLLLALLPFLLFSCGDKESRLRFIDQSMRDEQYRSTLEASPLNFETINKYILKPKCISCHRGPEAEPKKDPIDLTTYEEIFKDRFIPVIVKGRPEKSRLYKSVFEGKMPVAGKLKDVEIELIRRWIALCAPNKLKDIKTDCNDDGSGGDDGPGNDEPGNDEPI